MNKNVTVVKLQISRKKYQLIEAKNQEEVNLVEELNRDFYRFEKSEQRLRSRAISHDRLMAEYEYELPSSDINPLEKLLIEDRNKALYEAINSLGEMEKRIFILRANDELAFSAIASIVNLSKTAVIKKYNAAKEKLQNLLAEYK